MVLSTLGLVLATFTPTEWVALGSMATAVAALAGVIVSLRLAGKETRQVREAADKTVAVEAFNLQQEIRTWGLDRLHNSMTQRWRDLKRLRDREGYLAAKEQALKMSRTSVRASESVHSTTMKAVLRLFNARALIDGVLRKPESAVRDGKFDDFVRKRTDDAAQDVRRCLGHLASLIQNEIELLPLQPHDSRHGHTSSRLTSHEQNE